jgi:hypothetical protein
MGWQNRPYLGRFSATQKASQKGEAKNGLFSQHGMSRMWMVVGSGMTRSGASQMQTKQNSAVNFPSSFANLPRRWTLRSNFFRLPLALGFCIVRPH